MKSIWILCLLATLQLESCTVGYSFTGADIPAEANSFSVKTFQLATPLASANYNIQLTESFKDLMLSQTRLDLIEKRGDIQYEGVVTRFEIGSAAVSADEFTSLNRLTIDVRIKYVNTFDRDKNFEKSFSRFADYESNQDFGAVQEDLIRQINDQITQDIFDASLGNW